MPLAAETPRPLKLEITLQGPLALKLAQHAANLKLEPTILLCDLIERILMDNLVKAVLDND
jgi:hypothetical protein